MADKDTEKTLEDLRRLAVDLGKDGHFDMGARAATLHDLIKEAESEETGKG